MSDNFKNAPDEQKKLINQVFTYEGYLLLFLGVVFLTKESFSSFVLVDIDTDFMIGIVMLMVGSASLMLSKTIFKYDDTK
ncbi:MAG: hypothetical protein AB8B83_02230 [Bdellovibrionales bacterium]